MDLDVLIYGFGGHGRVLTELLHENGCQNIGVFDDTYQEIQKNYITFLGPYNPNIHRNTKLIIALGNNKVRHELTKIILHNFDIFIHPSAYISKTAQISQGTVVLQGAVIQSNAKIGAHTIINIGAKIDHDAQIGDFVHLAPQSYVGGGSIISSFVDLNPGQIIPRISKI